MTDPLLDDLIRAAQPPTPKDFRPGITYAGRDALGATINTDALPSMETEAEWEAAVKEMGIHIPEGYGLRLVKAELAGSTNEAAWHRDASDRGENHTAYTKAATVTRWRYQFEVVLKDPRADEDIVVLMKEARRKRPKTQRAATGPIDTKVINLADFQVSKVDVLGGTLELLERSEQSLAAIVAEVKADKPRKIILVDNGDSTEGFESSPNAERTNDLSQTKQIRVWRRIFMRWINELVPLVSELEVVSVPSNHCRVRCGKAVLGDPLDDWGIEVLSQVADILAVNPAAYGHVSCTVPNEYEEHVLIPLGGGRWVGFEHGHQASKPDGIADHLKKNGRAGIGQADYIFVGHFHHLRRQAFGHRQVFWICPTMDNGSSWFAPSGEVSDPGVLTADFDSDGHFVKDRVHWAI